MMILILFKLNKMNINRHNTECFFNKDWYQKIVLYNCLLKTQHFAEKISTYKV